MTLHGLKDLTKNLGGDKERNTKIRAQIEQELNATCLQIHFSPSDSDISQQEIAIRSTEYNRGQNLAETFLFP